MPAGRARGGIGTVVAFGLGLLMAGGAVDAPAQTAPPRRATTLAALVAYPAFYQGQSVLLRGTLATGTGGSQLVSDTVQRPVHAVFRSPAPPDGPVEARGEFWDLGRLTRDDPRLDSLRLRDVVSGYGEDNWPRPGEVFALVISNASTASPFGDAPSLRELAIEPERYAGRTVTITGQFRGRNLYGDLPQAPGVSPSDFVLRSADAAVWATGLRPRGRGFDLDVGAKADTGRWLRVTGTVREGKGLVWIEAEQVAAVQPAAEPAVPEPAPAPVVGPDAEVVFSDPSDGETDVDAAVQVRVQFSRDMRPDSFKDRVRVSYLREDPQAPSVQDDPIGSGWKYDPATRSILVRFPEPLARFRLVRIALGEGITATDGAPLEPWTLTFRVGGR